MKKKNLNQKLQLNKETIAKLNSNEMKNINGGATVKSYCPLGCPYTQTCLTICIEVSCNC